MSEEVLLKTDTIEITTKVARLGDVAYQVANIGSVAVHVTRKLNPFAVALFAVAIVLGLVAFDSSTKSSEQASLFLVAALALGTGGVAVQVLWPKLVSTLIIKTSSNDIYKMETMDGAHANAIRSAVEEAFVRRVY
jgi:hypothetical protein